MFKLIITCLDILIFCISCLAAIFSSFLFIVNTQVVNFLCIIHLCDELGLSDACYESLKKSSGVELESISNFFSPEDGRSKDIMK